MFRELTLGTLLALFFVVPAHAQSTQWVNVANFRDGKSFDIDLNSVEQFDSVIAYRTRIRLPRPDNNGAVAIGYRQAIDCYSGASQTLETLVVNRRNRVIFNKKYDNAPTQQIKQGTLGHKVYSVLCQEENNSDVELQRALVRAFAVDIPNAVSKQIDVIYNTRF